MTTNFTQAQLASLEAAIAEGVLRVEYEDRVVTYRTLEEMLRARELIRNALGLNAGASGTVRIEVDKGFDT